VRHAIARRRLLPPIASTHLADWPWRLRIFTLQAFHVTVDGAPPHTSTKAQKKPLELLKVLVAGGGQPWSLGTVAHHLWPDQSGDAALNALHTTVRRLRQLLDHESTVRVHEGRIALSAQHAWVDCWEFERCAFEIDLVAARQDDWSPAWAQAASVQLLRRYPGPFLPDDDTAWAMACRDRLTSKFLRLGHQIGLALEAFGLWDDAIAHHQRRLEVEPAAEEIHRDLMRALVHADRHAEALQAYHRCRSTLAGQLGVGPSPVTQRLAQSMGLEPPRIGG
jgi:DNA-binding SARP family transcriptional activator